MEDEFILKEMVSDTRKPQEGAGISASEAFQDRHCRDTILLSRIRFAPSGDMILIPNGTLEGAADAATDLAVLVHSRGIKTDPEYARDYGNAVTVNASQAPEALRVLNEYGLDTRIARTIARERGFTMPKRLPREIKPFDVESNSNGSHVQKTAGRRNGNGHIEL